MIRFMKIILFMIVLSLSFSLMAYASQFRDPMPILIDNPPTATSQNNQPLLTESETRSVNAALRELSEKHNMTVVVYLDSTDWRTTPGSFSRNWYADEELSEDGIMLYINVESRDIYITTSGVAERYFPNRQIERLLDDIADALTSGATRNDIMVYAGVNAFLMGVDARISGTSLLLQDVSRSLGIGAVISGIVLLIMFAIHAKSLPAPPRADVYMCSKGLQVTRRNDRIMHTRTTKIPIPKSNSSGGGGSFGGGMSSGGRSFGGGGRRF